MSELHPRSSSQLQLSPEPYRHDCIGVYREWIQLYQPKAVMAASNWQLALPAAIAAQEAESYFSAR